MEKEQIQWFGSLIATKKKTIAIIHPPRLALRRSQRSDLARVRLLLCFRASFSNVVPCRGVYNDGWATHPSHDGCDGDIGPSIYMLLWNRTFPTTLSNPIQIYRGTEPVVARRLAFAISTSSDVIELLYTEGVPASDLDPDISASHGFPAAPAYP